MRLRLIAGVALSLLVMTPLLPGCFTPVQAAESYMASLANDLKQKGFKVRTMVKTAQQVPAEIIDFAKESGADLIVMSTHGRSGFTRWFVGSVAHRVLTRAETPILLLRTKE